MLIRLCMLYKDKLCSHHRKMYLTCMILITMVLNFVPGVLAQSRSVTVDPATAKLGEDALMTFTFTSAQGEDIIVVVWFKSDADGATQGDHLLSITNSKYSVNNNNELVISNVGVNDAGYYLCRVITTGGNNAEGFSTLTVHCE
ncbi:uncharacterized protein LOC117121632 [Anneissia japonica]|uniref:uncharacterized protein LOC117121632 n=1 Tax=Anneissia japonica TaxID=1529436 RepID=UPI0014255256|nr:uncharacterized protein LOC117121632 [Anneissia japonica]